MPEYLTPGVYIEEVSFRSKSIEGVSTSTTAFVGPTLYGPVVLDSEDPNQAPELLTSFGDFEQIYGGLEPLELDGGNGEYQHNYLAHAVRAYFDNGGARLYVCRAALAGATAAAADIIPGSPGFGAWRARFPGRQGSRTTVRILRRTTAASPRQLSRAPAGSLASVGAAATAPAAITATNAPGGFLDGDTISVVATLDAAVATFSATLRERTSAALTGSVNFGGGPVDVNVRVSIDGRADVVIEALAAANIGDVVAAATAALGATAAVSNAGDDLIITSASSGPGSTVAVFGPTGIAYADTSATGVGTVASLAAVTLEELAAAFGAQTTFAIDASGGRLRFSLVDGSYVGATASFQVTGDAAMLARFGFPAPVTTNGSGAGPTWYTKGSDNVWTQVGAATVLDLAALEAVDAASRPPMALVSLDVEVRNGRTSQIFEDLGILPAHPRAIADVLRAAPASRREYLHNHVWLDLVTPPAAAEAVNILNALTGSGDSTTRTLGGGTDGAAPSDGTTWAEALLTLNRREDVSIVASPGYTAWDAVAARSIQSALINHVEPSARRNYRVAVLDTPEGQVSSEAIDWRAEIDSQFAALYYPWVITANPLARTGDLTTPREIALPPSGYVCGVYARTDILRGVHKAPANEVVRGAQRFERPISFDEQAILNPVGVNCLRTFPGRGHRVWGARTATSDPEWKYINVRRYFNYVEASIERGTQWAVFEPNGERLWANVVETIDAFLFNEWKNGALLGATPKESYFVRCDRSTMTQNDIDNGRLVCLIGVAPLRPAEFVIFRIGQMTADARD